MENTMHHRYGTNMCYIVHKYAELSAIPTEHSGLLTERSLRKFNSLRGRTSMQDLMVRMKEPPVRMKKRRRNSAQSKVLICRPIRESIQQWLSTAPYPKGVNIDPVHL